MHRLRPLIYAAFLACSWTWCIGMYLPILLMRDFGPWSFLVFAIPNCLGAAAMGVMLWRPDASQRFLANHFPACRVFSFVTITFQIWFVIMLVEHHPASAITLGLAAVIGLALGVLAVIPRLAPRAVASFLTFAASLGLLGWWLAHAGIQPVSPVPAHPLGVADLASLAPVCLLGFAFSPFLDLTFHAARQSVPGAPGSRTFLVAFLVLFPAMILFTFVYGRHVLAANPADPLPWPIAAHISIQAMFTAIIHGPGLRPAPRATATRRLPLLLILAVKVPLLLAAVPFALPAGFTYAGLSAEEIIYRLFMAFYGLVFPAYVLLAAVGADGFRGPPTTRTLITFAAAVALAAPFYWMGFIERQTPYLVPGVFVWLLARAVIKPGHADAPNARA